MSRLAAQEQSASTSLESIPDCRMIGMISLRTLWKIPSISSFAPLRTTEVDAQLLVSLQEFALHLIESLNFRSQLFYQRVRNHCLPPE